MFPIIPSWVRSGAAIDLDFANGQYWNCPVSFGSSQNSVERMKSFLTSGSAAPSSTVFTPWLDGIYRPNAGTGSLRIVPGMGLWVEKDATNYCLWCRDMTNAVWTKTNCTATKNQTGADGSANVASSITASNSAATCLQSVTMSSGSGVFSCLVKRITGTGTISITMDGSTYTDITSSINSSSYTLVQIAVTTITNPTVGFKIATSTDAIAVDFCQQEKVVNTGAATVATISRILTTSATATRTNGGGTEEAFFFTPASNYNQGIVWINSIICKKPVGIVWTGTGNGASGCLLTGTDVGGIFMTSVCDGNTLNGASGGVAGYGNINKVAFSQGGTNRRACINANSISSTANAYSNTQATHGGIGDRGAGDIPLNGYCSRVTFWMRELTDGEMYSYTS